MEMAPQFFRHGPSLLTRLIFFVVLSLVLMAIDTRFKYLAEIRQAFSTAIYPLQKLANVPSTVYEISEFFLSHSLVEENEHLKQQHLADSGQLQRFEPWKLKMRNCAGFFKLRSELKGRRQWPKSCIFRVIRLTARSCWTRAVKAGFSPAKWWWMMRAL